MTETVEQKEARYHLMLKDYKLTHDRLRWQKEEMRLLRLEIQAMKKK